MKRSETQDSRKPLARGRGRWDLLFINWLIPGAGFCLCGRWRRGLTQTALVLVTFAIGIGLRGGVGWPSGSLEDTEFSLLNYLTFGVQMGGGLPALASLAADLLKWPVLGGVPQHYLYELGSFYLVVAGAINYFSVLNLYDRIVSPHGRFLEQEQGTDLSQP